MRRLILLFLMVTTFMSSASAQFRRAEPVDPPFYIYKGSEYGRLMVRNKTTPEYFYYEAKENGDLRFPRWRLSDYSSTDSSTLYTSLPSGWAKYYLPCQLESGTLVAYWNVDANTSYPLYYFIIGGDTILAQGENGVPIENLFVHRGKNMLGRGDITTVVSLDSICNATFSYDTTGLNGLYEPSGFSTPSGYTLYYDADSTKIYSNIGNPIGSEAGTNLVAAITYTPTTTINSVNLTQFDNSSSVSGLYFGFGQGAPYFSNLLSTNPAVHFSKGWTASQSTALQPADSVNNTQISAFFNATGKMAEVAATMTGTYPDLSNVTTSAFPNLSAVSAESARQLGINVYFNKLFSYYNKEAGTNSKRIATSLFDEETWNYVPNQLSFMGNVSKGISQAMNGGAGVGSNGRVIVYGFAYAPNNFMRGEVTPYPECCSVSQVDGYANGWLLNGFEHTGIYTDANVEYYKTPVSDDSTYYQMSGGEYVLDGNGKRQLRTDSFTEYLFGDTTEFVTEPTATFISVNTTDCPDCIPSVANTRTDVYKAITQQYKFHDRIQTAQAARANYYGLDFTRRSNQWPRNGAILSLGTEPFTYGGNYHERRQIGKAGVLGQFIMAAMQGIEAIETWEDGTGGEVPVGRNDSPYQTAPSNGSQLYGEDLYYGEYEAATAAVQAIQDAYRNFTLDETLRYFSFSKYVISAQNKEILGGGFYQGDSLSVYFLYPYHDPSDTTSIEVQLGDTEVKLVDLVGRNPAIYKWGIDNSVTPQNIIASYINIDGDSIVVTGDIDNHYVGTGIITNEATGEPVDDNFVANESLGAVGKIYGSDDITFDGYKNLRDDISNGVAKFNFYGNTGATYPATQDRYTCCGGSGADFVTETAVAVDFPSHSTSYSADTGKVHMKLYDASDNLVWELYDTRGGFATVASTVRGNNHPDNCRRWVLRGDYRIWIKNLSDSAVMRYYFQVAGGPTLTEVNLNAGDEYEATISLQVPDPSTDGRSYKFNCNVDYP